jgi:hypothetical protein
VRHRPGALRAASRTLFIEGRRLLTDWREADPGQGAQALNRRSILNHAPRFTMPRKLFTLLVVLSLSGFALTARPSAAVRCECAPLGGEFCGADGRTYDSPCAAACFGRTTVVHSGPC